MKILSTNLKAFLDMIAASEGTAHIGDRGYNAFFGGGIFNSYEDHPRKAFFVTRLNIHTTAAGRYQILERFFDSYKKSLNLPDFSPKCQDAIAVQQITERGALPDIEAGNLFDAIKKCSNIWASLPGNIYGQPETRLEVLKVAYQDAGGTISDKQNMEE